MSLAFAARRSLNCSTSQLICILSPTRTDLFSLEWGIEGGEVKPNNSVHKSFHVKLVFPITDKPSTGTLNITSISCKVIPISLWGKYNVCISGRQCSTKAMINAWSTAKSRIWKSPFNPSLWYSRWSVGLTRPKVTKWISVDTLVCLAFAAHERTLGSESA